MNESERRSLLETAGTAQLQKSLAGYRIMRTLGQGSVGVVYLAEKLVGGTTAQFALKILKDLTFQNGKDRQGVIQRFYREAEIAASIRHPGVTTVFEYGVFGQDQIPYLIMEYVEGVALKRVIEEHQPLDHIQKARIIRQVADALAAVHLRGACHRDVKTSNILVKPDMQTKLTDFGIARPFNSDLTVAEDFVGTPAYSAPEAYASAVQVDHRADIFSLGVVAYELFFQERPFIADTLSLIGHEVCTRKPVAPRRRDGSFPRALQNILGKMLKKQPGERYQSASALVEDLDSFLSGTKLSETVSLWNHLHFADPDWS
jgi:serine/threonine-protein kinase